MKSIHRIALRATDAQRRELEALGVQLHPPLVLPGGGKPFLSFDVAVDHPSWLRLSVLLETWRPSDVRATQVPSDLARRIRLAREPSPAIVWTDEYFGDGRQADRRILVAQRVARALADGGIRGADLRPVKSAAI